MTHTPTVNWREVPLLRHCMPFIAGLVLYSPLAIPWCSAAAALAFLVALVIGRRRWSPAPRILQTWSAWFILGSASAWCAYPPDAPGYMGTLPGADTYMGMVIEHDPYARGTRVVLSMRFSLRDSLAQRISGKVLAYCRHPSDSGGPGIGDTMIFLKAPEMIPRASNPFQWDPASYYGNQGIYHRVFLSSDDYRTLSSHRFYIKRFAQNIRADVEHRLSLVITDTTSLGILKAMLLGDKTSVDGKLRTAYVRSGIVHILAISGLHIGIIAAILILLVGRPAPEQGRLLCLARSVVILSGIWGFTLVSGMSPSAARAALMCTIAVAGAACYRKSRP